MGNSNIGENWYHLPSPGYMVVFQYPVLENSRKATPLPKKEHSPFISVGLKIIEPGNVAEVTATTSTIASANGRPVPYSIILALIACGGCITIGCITIGVSDSFLQEKKTIHPDSMIKTEYCIIFFMICED